MDGFLVEKNSTGIIVSSTDGFTNVFRTAEVLNLCSRQVVGLVFEMK